MLFICIISGEKEHIQPFGLRQGGVLEYFFHRVEEGVHASCALVVEDLSGAFRLARFRACRDVTISVVDQDAVAGIVNLIAVLFVWDAHRVATGQKDLVQVGAALDRDLFPANRADRLAPRLPALMIDLDLKQPAERM